MLPTIEGIIARRILVNYWADPAVAAKLIPKPLEIAVHNGRAVVGICLIRLENIRPRGLPAAIGMSSENMAHRIAIRYPIGNGTRDGVYILRRDTDQNLVRLFGGRLFPGVHGLAKFNVEENASELKMEVRSADANIDLHVKFCENWNATTLFKSFGEMSEFFKKGDCGLSCSLRSDKLEGMQLKTLQWTMSPLQTVEIQSSFYDNEAVFPKGSIGLDCAVMMRGIPHEWHELSDVPELAVANKEITT